MNNLSLEAEEVLDALRAAVAEALERKRRLGQYAVVWRDGGGVRRGSVRAFAQTG